MTVEFGPGGRELVEIGEGDFIYIPGHLVHRESVAPDGGAGVIIRVGGVGATVFNVEGPDRQHDAGVALGYASAGPVLGSHDLVWTSPNRPCAAKPQVTVLMSCHPDLENSVREPTGRFLDLRRSGHFGSDLGRLPTAVVR